MPQFVVLASRVDDKFIVSVEASYDWCICWARWNVYLACFRENPTSLNANLCNSCSKGSLYIVKSRASTCLLIQNQTANWFIQWIEVLITEEFPASRQL